MASLGIDLSDHRSRPLEPGLLCRASRIYTMSESQCAEVRSLLEAAGGSMEEDALAPERLDPDGDIPDPLGSGLEAYEATRDRIRELLPPPPQP